MLSLVTACMNRDHHLRRSLPHWLALPGIDEVVIVDWSNRTPLDDLAQLDPRIRILRVEDEPRWVLPYAYNLGVARARGDLILKCDADCLPSPAVTHLTPAPGHFYAGDWRSGAPVVKKCVNGQCLFTRDQWSAVNGYSDLLRRYGHDDVDFYQRLVAAGHTRREITPDLLDFLEHDDADRVAHNPAPPAPTSVEALLHAQLAYHEAVNVVVTAFLPWGIWYPQANYTTLSTSADGRVELLRRDVSREIPVSDTLATFARNHAVRVVTGLLCKLPPAVLERLDTAACLARLSQLLPKPSPAPACASSS